MGKFVGFGDMLVSFSTVGYRRFVQSDTMEVNYTGAEANVCVSLAVLGEDTEFVTRLPQNDLAQCAVAELKKFGVGTERIVWGGDRIGVIYTEKGASQRPSKVVYDRKYTAIAQAKSSDIDWDKTFEGADWFHFTGITPALGAGTAELCMEACAVARKRGMFVSCDLNFRRKLWDEEKAHSVMEKLVPMCNLVVGNEEDADKVLGIKAEDSDVIGGVLSREGYINVARRIEEMYGVPNIAITLRESVSASDNYWSAMLYTKGEAFFSKKYNIHIVNRVGGGDSFSAGLIYALRHKYDAQHAVEFAAAASCLKHSIELDFNLVTVDEIERLCSGDGSGRVQR